MALRLFNTLTQRIEELVPLLPGHVRMYTCGPTVYHYVHIGNFRTFVFQDLLRRYLLFKKFKLTHVMNITDVEDKIIARALAEGLSIGEYTGRYIKAFLKDMQTLRIQQPKIMPKATDHIQDMVELIKRLQAKGLAYGRDGSIYFRIKAFPRYGRLGRIELNEIDPSGRFDSDEYSKENARDFALWKSHRPNEASWDSELGPGRPGWHIECSAMSMKYLGSNFDIHCGGKDLIFPHHENEIAQSEGATGLPFVNQWVHAAHLIVNGEKMSKSSGNFYTLRDLVEAGFQPLAVRYLLSSVHYRKQLNFTFEGLEQAWASIQRVNDFLQRVAEIPDSQPENPHLTEALKEARQGFEQGLDADLNTSEALGSLFKFIRQANIALDGAEVGTVNRDAILDFFEDANQVFATFKIRPQAHSNAEILRQIEQRNQARLQRNFALADQIRDQFMERGIVLEDTKEGTRWKTIR